MVGVVSRDSRRALSLAALLAGAGATHFAVPKFYDEMIPEQLPGAPRIWTYGSAIAEFATAAAVAVPRTRHIGGLAAPPPFAPLLPGNNKKAVDPPPRDSLAHPTRKPPRPPGPLPPVHLGAEGPGRA